MDNIISISYNILVHNEDESLKNLLQALLENIQEYDEIVIIDDYSDNPKTIEILEEYKNSNFIKIYQNKLNMDFAQQKNFANSKSTKEYIFNIDADEMPSSFLLKNIRQLISLNREVDAYKVPRINKVDGITLEHIGKWNWNISSLPSETKEEVLDLNGSDLEKFKFLKVYNLVITDLTNLTINDPIKYFEPIINFPDLQTRIYKNNNNIKWMNKVHEVLVGYDTFSVLPSYKNYSLLHYKNIKKQEQQNNLYSQIK